MWSTSGHLDVGESAAQVHARRVGLALLWPLRPVPAAWRTAHLPAPHVQEQASSGPNPPSSPKGVGGGGRGVGRGTGTRTEKGNGAD